MNYDRIIIKYLLNKNNKFNNQKIIKLKKYPNIFSYLNSKYKDSYSLKETLWRIRYNIQKRPVCKECSKQVKFIGLQNHIYSDFCSNKCAQLNKETRIKFTNTCLNRYGVTHISKLDTIKEKKSNTCLSHYGVNVPFKSNEIKEKIKQTCIQKYGVDWITKSDIQKNKSKMTCISNYGVDNISKLESNKKWTHRPEVIDKIIEAKKRNHTFNTSKPEEELFDYIKYKFPLVKRQYKDNIRYPWRCDFYIPELDCFIEYNGHQSHGTHPYNSDSIEDQIIVERWKEKYNNGEHPLYKSMVEGWTINDVKKRNKAKEENLNFHEFWNLNNAKQYIDILYEKYRRKI